MRWRESFSFTQSQVSVHTYNTITYMRGCEIRNYTVFLISRVVTRAKTERIAKLRFVESEVHA